MVVVGFEIQTVLDFTNLISFLSISNALVCSSICIYLDFLSASPVRYQTLHTKMTSYRSEPMFSYGMILVSFISATLEKFGPGVDGDVTFGELLCLVASIAFQRALKY